MNREQVYELLTFIKNFYPIFQVDQSKINHWSKLLRNQNPAIVMRNAERYVLAYKFPPTLSDLLESHQPAFCTDFIKLRNSWEREALAHQSRS